MASSMAAPNCNLICHKTIAQKGFGQIENVPGIFKMISAVSFA